MCRDCCHRSTCTRHARCMSTDEGVEVGQVVFEQYRIQECIAEGRASVVWRAVDIEAGGSFALKLYTHKPSYTREVAMLKQFHHPACALCESDGCRASSTMRDRLTTTRWRMDAWCCHSGTRHSTLTLRVSDH